eukprot:261802-Ditylum_brightwellii.AAC.1
MAKTGKMQIREETANNTNEMEMANQDSVNVTCISREKKNQDIIINCVVPYIEGSRHGQTNTWSLKINSGTELFNRGECWDGLASSSVHNFSITAGDLAFHSSTSVLSSVI